MPRSVWWRILKCAAPLLLVACGASETTAPPMGASAGAGRRQADAAAVREPRPSADRTAREAPALRAYIDPETGELLAGPRDGGAAPEPSPEERESLRTDHRDLLEEPLPEGGFAVDLEGRFASSVVASVDESGRLTTRCVVETAAESSERGER